MFRPSIVIALAVATLAAGCGGSSGGSPPAGTVAPATELSVALDWYPNPDHVGLFSAMDEGQFAKRGLVVKTEEPSDVSDPISWSPRAAPMSASRTSPSCSSPSSRTRRSSPSPRSCRVR